MITYEDFAGAVRDFAEQASGGQKVTANVKSWTRQLSGPFEEVEEHIFVVSIKVHVGPNIDDLKVRPYVDSVEISPDPEPEPQWWEWGKYSKEDKSD